jgi:hypothetical protein
MRQRRRKRGGSGAVCHGNGKRSSEKEGSEVAPLTAQRKEKKSSKLSNLLLKYT